MEGKGGRQAWPLDPPKGSKVPSALHLSLPLQGPAQQSRISSGPSKTLGKEIGLNCALGGEIPDFRHFRAELGPCTRGRN